MTSAEGHERERARDHLVAVSDGRPLAARGADRRYRSTPRSRGRAEDGDAKAASKAGRRGPSDSWPERSTSSTACSSASPRTGRASDTTSLVPAAVQPGAGSSPSGGGRCAGRRPVCPAGSRRGAPGLHAELERIDERLPRRLDDVLRHTDRAPHLLAVGRVDENARHRRGALGSRRGCAP